ncbi:DMT family transporter [Deinococcus sp. 12RED42]|uniref:DMT family transporter n=2 Tax=unclassified Deinococcus TaxID=2623546 RepID=UPI001E650536|nr:DMT family transporter [Deinococcus sp. 12RED42]MCD0164505.1 DMT family transporter [Deinococcus sp. 12RED42]
MSVQARGVVLLVLVTCLWGSTFAVVKTLGETLPPAVLIAWRFLIAAVALLPLLLWRPGRAPSAAPRAAGAPGGWRESGLWRDGAVLGAWLIAGYGTQTIALQTTSANRAAFFTALSVVLVPVWLVFAQRRRMPALLWTALPLAVAGLALLSWEGGALVVGDAWALACAVTYAGFIVTLERMAHRHAALPFTLVQVLTVTVLAWVWAALSAPGQLWPPAGAWAPLVYLGVAATAATTLMQTVGQRTVSAANASLIYALEPVTATLFSFLLIGERVGLRGALGGLLVVVATVLSQRSDEPHPETPAVQAS